MIGVYFYPRKAYRGDPAGITVSKRSMLPDGEFGITEYAWGNVSLWFVNEDEFSADERQSAYYAFCFGETKKEGEA